MALEEPGASGGILGGISSALQGVGGPSRRSGGLRKEGFGSRWYLPVLIPALLLVAYGLVVVWSASLYIESARISRQLLGVALGSACAFGIWRYDIRSLSNMSRALFVLDIVLILMPSLPVIGYSAKGMTGWIRVFGVTFQPSEVAKLVTIMLMASVTAQYNGKIEKLSDYVRLCATLLVPFILILTQPDLGTGLVLLVSGACIIICGGAERSWVLVTIAMLVAGIALIIWTSMTPGLPHVLKTYQLNRLIVFVDSSVDPTGVGYNLQQAKIAVGSGGLLGRGIGNATQAGQGFLPEAHTDFVFALLSEEFGFLGAVVLLGLFAALIFSTLGLAMRSESPFIKLVLVGVIAMWTFQLLESVGMCIGLMPITGIPLPFISYGSSSMLAQLSAVGIVLSAWHHRQKSA